VDPSEFGGLAFANLKANRSLRKRVAPPAAVALGRAVSDKGKVTLRFGGSTQMRIVKEILDTKGRDVWSVAPTHTVFEAVQLLSDKGVGALLVMDEQGLVGIVTERDYARKVILEGRSSRTTPVGDVMTTSVLCVDPDKTVEECMALMTEKRTRHLPVLEAEQVVGIVSIGDLVKAIIAEQQFMIEQLQHYITH
jgi:CBS domain-containing protein